jgi:hypothetical protein
MDGKFKITNKSLKTSFKPYDIVTDKDNNVGFIREVSINECQPEPHQITYAVEWLVGNARKTAWYHHSDLIKHCNLFVKIAECSCHPFGQNEEKVSKLMGIGL